MKTWLFNSYSTGISYRLWLFRLLNLLLNFSAKLLKVRIHFDWLHFVNDVLKRWEISKRILSLEWKRLGEYCRVISLFVGSDRCVILRRSRCLWIGSCQIRLQLISMVWLYHFLGRFDLSLLIYCRCSYTRVCLTIRSICLSLVSRSLLRALFILWSSNCLRNVLLLHIYRLVCTFLRYFLNILYLSLIKYLIVCLFSFCGRIGFILLNWLIQSFKFRGNLLNRNDRIDLSWHIFDFCLFWFICVLIIFIRCIGWPTFVFV